MPRPIRLFLPLFLLALALTACYEPLEYELVIDVSDTGAYAMSFDGTIGALGLREAQLEGATQEELDEMMAEIDVFIADRQDVEVSEYRGDGVYYVRGQAAYSGTDTDTIFDMWLVEVSRQLGELTFRTVPFDQGTLDMFASFGYELEGRIILRSEAPIIESNGKQGPDGHYWENEVLLSEGMRITLVTP